MSSPTYDDAMSTRDVESGYASASSSEASLPDVYFSKPHLKFLNRQLQQLEPEGMSTQQQSTYQLMLTAIDRCSKMVHHYSAIAISDNSFWANRPCYS